MELFVSVCLLTMADASPCGGHLQVTTLKDFSVTHRVSTKVVISLISRPVQRMIEDILFYFAGDHIGEDFEFSMSMCAEACVRLYTIFV